MKLFLKKIAYFLFPLLIIILGAVICDFFKVQGFYKDYYKDSNIGLNREMVCTKTYNHYRDSLKYDSFIFGSSRSRAFKCQSWVNYLEKTARPFHFDASGEGVWGISKKIQYIASTGDTIRNALVVLDRTTLKNIKGKRGHLYIAMPCVSEESKFQFYLEFIKASVNFKFLSALIDYSLFQKHRPYMGGLIVAGKYKDWGDPITCDYWFGHDKNIEADSNAYYNDLVKRGVFFKRTGKATNLCKVTDLEMEQLQMIKDVFRDHETNYRIVLSPVYDQVPMEEDQLKLLYRIFGEDHVFDFSGKNDLTDPIGNYYEYSHYRPNVADAIMNSIYQ